LGSQPANPPQPFPPQGRTPGRDPDLLDTAMNLVFTIENQALSTCGVPTAADLALTLLASAGRYAER